LGSLKSIEGRSAIVDLKGVALYSGCDTAKGRKITHRWRKWRMRMPPTDNQEEALSAHFPGTHF
jgi:hypothetical protein